MAREKGDKNFSERELRLRAQNQALKAKVKAVETRFKGELKVKEVACPISCTSSRVSVTQRA